MQEISLCILILLKLWRIENNIISLALAYDLKTNYDSATLPSLYQSKH